MNFLHPTTAWRRISALLVTLALTACGGSDEPTADSAATATSARTAPADSGSETAPSAATNGAPEIHSIRFEPEEPVVGDSVRAIVEARDPNGDSLWVDYAWRIDRELVSGDTERLLLRGVERGQSVEVSVSARDGKGGSVTRSHSSDIRNAPPKLGHVRVEPSKEVVAGTPIVVRPEATDADADAMTFRYEWLVNDASVRETGPKLDTDRLNRGDRVRVAVYVSDGRDEAEPVSLPELLIVNAPPRILDVSGEPSASGEYAYRVRAEDPDGDAQLQFELDGPPDGMSIDAVTGDIKWRPSPKQVGTHSVAVIVADLHGGRSRQTIEITVSPASVAAQPPAKAR